MSRTIHYDRPILNLIDELDATGHVTHTRHRKTSVTLHHNGGRLTRRDVLRVWRTRPASAHFDVDVQGRLAQYVRVHEYAWACGNTEGNKRSIHIEMANLSLGPRWRVNEETWHGAARLAGWLHAHVLHGHPRPTRHSLFYHHHWLQTDCAGPFMDSIYGHVLHRAQRAYDHFTS